MRSVTTACLCGVGWLVFATAARSQDLIRYWDRAAKKEASASGNIVDETAGRVAFKGTGAGLKEVPAQEIIDITYEVPGGQKLAYSKARADENKSNDPVAKEDERRKALDEALKVYKDLQLHLGGERAKYAQRHAQYKIARLLARLAEDDPSRVDEASQALLKFKTDHPDSWQIIQVSKSLAKLQLQKRDREAARKTYEDLAAVSALRREARREAELLAIETLIDAKRCADAEKKLLALLNTADKADPLTARIRVYRAECLAASGKLPEAIAQLEAIISQTQDKDLKAVAYNGLGDCYRLNGRPRDALWPYLWVDVIYHQDRDEHIKAMTYLAQLFRDQGDAVRAQQYRDRLHKAAQ